MNWVIVMAGMREATRAGGQMLGLVVVELVVVVPTVPGTLVEILVAVRVDQAVDLEVLVEILAAVRVDQAVDLEVLVAIQMVQVVEPVAAVANSHLFKYQTLLVGYCN